MYVAVDKRNVIYGYCVSDCSFGAELKKNTISIDRIPDDAFDDRGIPTYMLNHEEGNLVKRTWEEMDADYAARPPALLSDKERIAALEDALTAIEEGIASV